MTAAFRRTPASFALALTVFAFTTGSLVQKTGCNQTSHYALVRALSEGTAQIDPWQETTCDKSWYDGHFYSNKAPGLALVTLPYFFVLKTIFGVPEHATTAVWALGLAATVLVAVVLLGLVRAGARRLADNRTAVATAIAVGLGTLVLPFATLVFAHLLSAVLLLGAFLLAWDRRLLLAGLLAGFAVVVEYPNALVALVLGGYVIAATRRARPLAEYAVGGVVGVLPLLVYNQLAFGSVTHLSYVGSVLSAGGTGHDVVYEPSGESFFGIQSPSLGVAAGLATDSRGLFVLMPVVLVALASLVLMWRRGFRAEAGFIGAAVLGAFMWNASLTGSGPPVGGDVPGPRYLLPVLPLAMLPLAFAFRAIPRTTGLLTAVSAGTMILATVTTPMLGHDDTGAWVRAARDGQFTHTVLTFVGVDNGWLAILPALVGFAVLLALFARSGWLALPGEPWWQALVALGVWAVAASIVPNVLDPETSTGVQLLALALAIAALVTAARWISEARPGSRGTGTSSADPAPTT